MNLFRIFLGTVLCLSLNAYAAPNLMDKHGPVWPQPEKGFVTKNQCMACHGDYKALSAKTSDYVVNPHTSHLGEVNCVECHKPNQAKPDLMCNQCHKFDIKKK